MTKDEQIAREYRLRCPDVERAWWDYFNDDDAGYGFVDEEEESFFPLNDE